MATDRRIARVAEMIRREASQLLMTGIKDDRVGTGMASITTVVVSGDLQHAKIFVSIYGTDDDRAATMEGLKSATGYVRGVLGQRIRLRRTPEILFVEDRGLQKGTEVMSLIGRLTEERKASGVEDWLNQAAAQDALLELEDDQNDDLDDLDLEDNLEEEGDLEGI